MNIALLRKRVYGQNRGMVGLGEQKDKERQNKGNID
jgi:hypothetical protein